MSGRPALWSGNDEGPGLPKSLYHQRGAVEREFGVLKHQRAMLPLRVRRVYRVRLHVDLTILAQLASALIKTRT